jgi:hypothetical protein
LLIAGGLDQARALQRRSLLRVGPRVDVATDVHTTVFKSFMSSIV